MEQSIKNSIPSIIGKYNYYWESSFDPNAKESIQNQVNDIYGKVS